MQMKNLAWPLDDNDLTVSYEPTAFFKEYQQLLHSFFKDMFSDNIGVHVHLTG